MALKPIASSIVLGLLLLHLLSCTLSTAETVSISGSFTVSKGDSKYDGMTYDITGMQKATGNAVVNIGDAEVTGGGLTFLGFTSVPSASVYALNMSIANTAVTDSTITLRGCIPRHSEFYFSNTKGVMSGTTPLFVFTDVVPHHYVIINIVDTNVSWPVSSSGGDVLQIGKTQSLAPMYYSAVYITRANAYNAAHIWNVQVSLSTLMYFVNVLDKSMVAVDYVNCYNCKNAFIYSSNDKTPPVVGSEACFVRYSNCTQTGGKPFYAAASQDTFSFGPNNGNIIFSGITTDGPFFEFNQGCKGQVKRYTMLAFMHINALSSGILASNPFPLYLLEGFPNMPDCHVFMGNVTLSGKTLSTTQDYASVYLKPKYIVDAYSKFMTYGAAHSISYAVNDYVYASGAYTAAYCAMGGGVASIGVETLGDNSDGGKLWTRPKCVCNDGFWAPYCTATYDPLLYYAGYTFRLVDCAVDNCTQCWWGQPDKCTECAPTFMLYPSTWSCVPNICGECPTDDGKLYTYTGGKCVVNAIANCAAVDTNAACVSCNDGYSLYNGNCVQCNVENCALCSSTNYCKQCNTDQSYTVDSSGQCTYCGDYCTSCSATLGCQACSSGYTLSESKFCTSVCSLSGCTTCATATTCSVCDTGLTLTSDKQCSCNIANCDTCYGTRCGACAYGYYYNLKANTCDPVDTYVSAKSASDSTRVTLTTILLLATLFTLV